MTRASCRAGGAILLGSVLAGCSIFESPGGGVNLISVDQEWQMGRELAVEVDQQMELISTPWIDSYLSGLGGQLLAASNSELARLPWSFHLVKDDSVNAFNLPGGHVYVHTGLVKALHDHAELASVIGHEIGHGLARHATRQMTQQIGLSALLAIALGNDPSQTEAIVATLASQGAIQKFSRDDEREADRIGIQLLYGAGIDPQGSVDMLRVLDSLQRQRPSSIERFLSSHPEPAARIADAQARIDALPPRENVVRQTQDFLAFQKYVATLAARP
jgi:predicted Zn-dependent protease